jgi:hypothetical protein
MSINITRSYNGEYGSGRTLVVIDEPIAQVGTDALCEIIQAVNDDTSTPGIEIRRPDDERIEFWIGGEEVGWVSHDEHGRAGMQAVEDMVRKLADVYGADITETEGV